MIFRIVPIFKNMPGLFFIILLILCPVFSWSQVDPVAEIRNELFFEEFDEAQTRLFYEKVGNIVQKTPVIKAYEGVAEALLAKTVWNPFTKISYLRTSRDKLNEAILNSPGNIEIRFLRFSTQYYLPSILGFSDDLQEDKEAIMNNLEFLNQNDLEDELLQFIIQFMEESNLCSNEEIITLQNKLNNKG